MKDETKFELSSADSALTARVAGDEGREAARAHERRGVEAPPPTANAFY